MAQSAHVQTDQLIVFGVLAATLVLFIWNRWRYDLVAVFALLVIAVAGLVPPEAVFTGLGHPAVVTVAAVLVISRGLQNAGVVDAIARQITRVGNRPVVQLSALTALVAVCSGFINNVGALALFMPVAVWMSRQSGTSPSLMLMPLAFGSLLGGTLSLIGTPPNIIIASYRKETGAAAFGMFDFLPVGAALTIVGVLFIAAVGWRLVPQRKSADAPEDLFAISGYVTELRVRQNSRYVGQTLHALLLELQDEAELTVIALIRSGNRRPLPSMFEILLENDILLVEADSDSLSAALDDADLELATPSKSSDAGHEKPPTDLNLQEAIVKADSVLVGSTATALELRERYRVNELAVARQGQRLRTRVKRIRFVAGDILLVQASEETMSSVLNELGCLPLALRGLQIGKPRKIALAVGVFLAATALISFNVVSPATALVGAALIMVVAGIVAPKEIYTSIDMPVVVLLAAMLPIGHALETTGGSDLIATQLLAVAQSVPPGATVALLMGSVMVLTNVINNAAAAVLTAPIAISVAAGMQVSADPLLMAVAIGSSCAFLTPIGHQSNTLVMAPGGYQFNDYWKLGLPLSVLVLVVGVPMILWVWPF